MAVKEKNKGTIYCRDGMDCIGTDRKAGCIQTNGSYCPNEVYPLRYKNNKKLIFIPF